MMSGHDDHCHIILSPSTQSLFDQVMAGPVGIAVCSEEYRCDRCVFQHFCEPVTAEHDQVVRSDWRRGQLRFHVDVHSQAFSQDVTIRMYERRGRINQAALHKFLDEGMIARQLCKLS